MSININIIEYGDIKYGKIAGRKEGFMTVLRCERKTFEKSKVIILFHGLMIET